MHFEIWVALAGVAVAFPAAWLYNRLVAGRNLVRQGYAGIDVQLKRSPAASRRKARWARG